jgi:prepilin-type N-terminal cleavage/methylation domain-containing protein
MRIQARTNRHSQRGFSLLEVAASILIIGIGVFVYLKVQGIMRKHDYSNSKLLLAGQFIDRHVENLRIEIARDTNANWPPATGFKEVYNGITLERMVTPAISPNDGATLDPVRKVDIIAYWGQGTANAQDTLWITTYVSKRF